MGISSKISEKITKASWIRRMFTEGIRLKELHGAENVFDFSLGNPDVDPPARFYEELRAAAGAELHRIHGYMPNAGYPDVRQRLAKFLGAEFGLPFTQDNLIMTVGAAGGINTLLKTLLDPGEEVVVLKPYFVEYGFYIDNHGGVMVETECHDTFVPDLDDLEAKLGPRTKAVLVNSPNNPTGVVYQEETLRAIAELLSRKSAELGRTIYLITDEPYRYIYYGDHAGGSDTSGRQARALSPIEFYDNTIMVSSHSKDISLPGERIGYIAVHPRCEAAAEIYSGCAFTIRILGFVNAPALMQRVTSQMYGVTVDVEIYRRRRDLLCEGLAAAGYSFNIPEGAFYLFPSSPIADDVAFCKAALEERILVTPGTGFKMPGYFRISYCISEQVITNALPGFTRLMKRFR